MYFTDNFVNGGKVDRQALEKSLEEKFKISKNFMEPIITLFIRFELGIPLDKNTFLIPSLLQSKKIQFGVQPCNFPRVRTVSQVSAYASFKSSVFDFDKSKTDSLKSNLEFGGNKARSGTRYMPAMVQETVDKQIKLLHTGMCYRRIFAADHIPSNFWPRLIARLLSSAESFQKIICHNCFSEIRCQNFVDGSAGIGALKCEWSYGKNHIELILGGSTLLCVNGLYTFHEGSRREKICISNTVHKVEQMQIYHGSAGFKQINLNDGFEVTIPDYIVHSGPNLDNLVHQSEHMSYHASWKLLMKYLKTGLMDSWNRAYILINI